MLMFRSSCKPSSAPLCRCNGPPPPRPAPPHHLPPKAGISLSSCLWDYFSLCLSVYFVSVFASVFLLSLLLSLPYFPVYVVLRRLFFFQSFFYFLPFIFCLCLLLRFPLFRLVNCLSSLFISLSRFHFPYVPGTREK